MTGPKMPADVDAFLAGYPDGVREIAVALRGQVLASLPGVREMVDRPGRVIGYGSGPGYSELICTIIPSKTGVKLGIVGGAALEDPDGLLEGAGKRHRYVPFVTAADLRRPALARLLKSAARK